MQSTSPRSELSADASGSRRLPSYARPTLASLSTLLKRSSRVAKPPARQVSKAIYRQSISRSVSKPIRSTLSASPSVRSSVKLPRKQQSATRRARPSLLESIGVKPHAKQQASQYPHKKIADLEAQVANLAQDRHHLLTKIEQKNETHGEHEQLEQSRARVQELEKFQQLALARSAEFEQALHEIQQEKKSFAAVTTGLREKLVAIESDLQAKSASSTKELDAAKYKVKALQNVVHELQSQVDRHTAVDDELAQLKSQLADVRAAHRSELDRCEALQTQLSNNNQQLEDAQQRIARFESQLGERDAKIDHLESSLQTAQSSVVALGLGSSADIDEMRHKLNEALTVASAAEEMAASLMAEKEQYHRDSLNAQTLLMSANDQIAVLQRERSEAVEEANLAKARFEAANAQIQELQISQKQYEQTIENLRAGTDSGRLLDEQTRRKIEELESRIEDERQLALEYKQYAQQYDDASSKLRETENTLRAATADHEAQIAEIRRDAECQVSLARAEAQASVSAAQDAADIKLQEARHTAQDEFWLAQDSGKTCPAPSPAQSRADAEPGTAADLASSASNRSSVIKDVLSLANVPRLDSPDIYFDNDTASHKGLASSSPSRSPSAGKTPRKVLCVSKAENYKLIVNSMTKEKKHKKKSPHKSHKSKSSLRVA